MERELSQKQRILKGLQRGERLTALRALEKYGCLRLAARIWELKREGFCIQERTVKLRTGKVVTEYWMR